MTHPPEPRRRLRTVLLTDIVGSTAVAAQLGDRRWRELVARHHGAIRRELKRHRGREIDTAGDGFFATFESPTDGLRCARAAVAAVHGLGLRIRAGLHTGEVEVSGEKVGGIAVHIAARLLAIAEAEEVLVSGTLHDLVAGSGLEFEERGSHELRGVPGTWRVHSLILPPLDESVVTSTEEEAAAAAAARRRRWIAASSGAVILVAALVALGVALLMPQPEAPPFTGPDSVVAFRRDDGMPVAGVATGRGPAVAEVVDGSVWVANVDSGTVTRVDRSDGTTDTVGLVSSRPIAIEAVGDVIWVADRYSDEIAILDARAGELQEQVQLHASALSAGDGSMWATDDLHDAVRRLDPRDGAELAVLALPAGSGPSDVDASEDEVWVAAARGDRLLRIDARTDTVAEASVEVPAAERISVAGGDLWAVSPSLDIGTRVDVESSRVAVRASVCDSPVEVEAELDGGAWIACSIDRSLWHVDHAGAPLHQIPLDGVPTDVALDGDRVWVTLRED